MKKKLVSAILTFSVGFSLAACGGSNSSTSQSSASVNSETTVQSDLTTNEESSKANADASGVNEWDTSNIEPVRLKLAHIYAAEHPFTIGLDEFCEKVDELSDGKLKIEHFSGAQLGDEPSIHEGLKNGSVDMAVMGISEAGKDYEPVLVMDAPFIFTDAKQMLAAQTSDTGTQLWKDFKEQSGITMLTPIYYGTRQLTTKEKVSSVNDLKGMKIRVPSQQNSVDVWNTLGAVATPMNLSETYLSIQTGVVDGQENPLATIMSQAFDEVCNYLNMTSHSVQSCPLFISNSTYENLDPTLRKILDYCVSNYVTIISQDIIDYEERTIGEIENKGKMEVNIDVDIDSFKNALTDYIKEGASTWGSGVYDSLSSVKAN